MVTSAWIRVKKGEVQSNYQSRPFLNEKGSELGGVIEMKWE